MDAKGANEILGTAQMIEWYTQLPERHYKLLKEHWEDWQREAGTPEDAISILREAMKKILNMADIIRAEHKKAHA